MAQKTPQTITINDTVAYSIEGFDPCYFLTQDCRVISLKHGKTAVLQGVIGKNGYRAFTLRRDGRDVRVLLHRLVAAQFCEKPDGCDFVNHKDGNKLNNQPSNLEWVTAGDNVRHALATGLMSVPSRETVLKAATSSHSKNAKFTEEEAERIVQEYWSMPQPEYAAIAKRRGCHTETIRRIVLGKQKIFRAEAA
jgi:hypothetical protein